MKNLFSQKSKVESQKFKNHFRRFFFPISYFLFPIASLAQQQVKDTTTVNSLDEVLISAIRVNQKTPISYSNLTKEEIAKRNLGQDIPVLMNFLPSVVVTSDAGNGIGYTGIRVRGSDASRTNVTINGIPYNDAESSGTFFVNLPDFASSVESLQLQRGVGTSTNGAGAFGASLNLLTDKHSKKSYGEISNSVGSFNSFKHSVKFSTGLLNDSFEIAGRLSMIKSDGYIDRASSNMKSFFLQGTYVGTTTLLKAVLFGGIEKTYQSWYGVDSETLATDRTFNFAGMYTDENGNTKFYEHQTDNYQQDNFQLHWNEKINSLWQTNLAIHYTKGKGYYENYNESDFYDFGLYVPIEGLDMVDYIDRKWLDNDFYGTTFSANYTNNKTNFILGGAINKYEGSHFGNVIWAREASTTQPSDRYYDFYGNKLDANFFAKINYKLSSKLSLFGDVQFRNVNYKADGVANGMIDKGYNFVNPKAGLTYKINSKNDFYYSYARANREPSRIDFENGNPKHESLDDFELGWRYKSSKAILNTNFYFMNYKNQLVKTGELDEVGYEIRSNVLKSYRTGIEIDANLQISKMVSFSPNLTLSSNKINNYTIDTGEGLKNYGTTNLSFSPSVIYGSSLSFVPKNGFQLSLLHKYVGKQYAGSMDLEETKLDAYTVLDFNLVYEVKPKVVFESIVFTGLINNIFDAHYVSNAYLYGENNMSYYPQAGINFLCGITFKF